MSPPIASARNRRVVWARKLRQRKYRQAERRFLVEGLQLIRMGLDSGRAPDVLFYSEGLFAGAGAPAVWERSRAAGAELVPVTAEVMAGLSDRDTSQGLLAAFSLIDVEVSQLSVATPAALVLVLDRLQTPGNLGTLVRTADAAGAAAVVLLEPGADVYDLAAVRSSMGSLFSLPIVRGTDPALILPRLPGPAWRVMGADPHQGELWTDEPWDGRVALVLGNEARGLSADVRPHVRAWIRLPMSGGADSLNVAVTGGILMYAWVGRNLPLRGSPRR